MISEGQYRAADTGYVVHELAVHTSAPATAETPSVTAAGSVARVDLHSLNPKDIDELFVVLRKAVHSMPQQADWSNNDVLLSCIENGKAFVTCQRATQAGMDRQKYTIEATTDAENVDIHVTLTEYERVGDCFVAKPSPALTNATAFLQEFEQNLRQLSQN